MDSIKAILDFVEKDEKARTVRVEATDEFGERLTALKQVIHEEHQLPKEALSDYGYVALSERSKAAFDDFRQWVDDVASAILTPSAPAVSFRPITGHEPEYYAKHGLFADERA